MRLKHYNNSANSWTTTMKIILKLIIGLLIPNLFLAFWIDSIVKRNGYQNRSQIIYKLDFIFFLAAMIVIIPCLLGFYFTIFEHEVYSDSAIFIYLKFTTILSLLFGILISFIYLHKSNSLQVSEH